MSDRASHRAEAYRSADDLVRQEQYDRAVAVYEALLAEDPEDSPTRLRLMDLFLKMKQYPEAITACECQAENFRRKHFYNLAIIFYVHAYAFLRKYVPHLEDRFGHLPSRLAETFAEIIAESPQFAAQNGRFLQSALATRGALEDTEHALIEILRKVIDIDRSRPLPYLCLIDALLRVGDIKNANTLRDALAIILAKQGSNA